MWQQDDKHALMDISSIAPLDRFHTICFTCKETVPYLRAYKLNGFWYCGKCYRDTEPVQGRHGSKRNDRAS